MTAGAHVPEQRFALRYLALCVLAALLAFQLAAEVRTAAWLADGSRVRAGLLGPAGLTWDLARMREAGGFPVEGVDRGSEAERTGLLAGDLILSVNGVRLKEHPEAFFRTVTGGEPGDAVALLWQRAGLEQRGVLTLGRATSVGAAPSPWPRYGPYILPSVLMLLVGAWIGVARARDRLAFRVALLLLVLGQSLSVFIERAPTLAVWPLWALACTVAASRLAIYPLALLAVQVLAVFPNPSPAGRWILRRTWILVPYAVLSVESALEAVGRVYGTRYLPAPLTAALDRMVPWKYLWLALLVIAALLIVAQRIETRGRREVRLGVVEAGLVGTVAGGFWVLFLWTSDRFWSVAAAPESVILSDVFRAIGTLLPVLLLCSLPLSLGYSVLARRVFGIRLIVRRGIRYLLLSRGVILAEGFLLFAILGEAVRLSQSEAGGSVLAVTGIAGAVTIVVILVLVRVNRPLMRAIDRRFFRESYDARRLLLELGKEMLTLRERDDVLSRAGAVLLDTLHATRVAFLLRDQASGEARLAWQVPAATRGTPGSPVSGPIEEGLTALEEGGYSWDIPATGTAAGMRDEEAPFELLIALRGNTGLLGCIALGAKRSDEPYGREDRELLVTVATQMGFALENAALLGVAKREAEQARELSIARRVQEGLFPSALPEPGGWSFAAVCRPARAVGGDYYDLFAPDPEHVVLALGDVSGKGLGPSLVMSAVQALIRNHLRRSVRDLTDLAGQLNEHLLESSSSETFVTLFVGVLEVGSGRLRYVNAGHNPPLLICGAGTERHLTEGGTLIGMFDGAAYVEGQALVAPGSLLVLYSDGVTEARDRAGEFYGDERLTREIRASRSHGATDALGLILASVDRFADGAEQADDLSIVVALRRT